jgi:hypothetical protein
MRLARFAFACALVIFLSAGKAWCAERQVLRVGPGQALKTPSAAAKIARDSDTIEIEAGIYAGDAAVWTQNGLTIRAVGGRAQLRANGAQAEDKAIWVIKGARTTIEGIEFSGAKVPHLNGAGIRLEGPGLTVRSSRFHDNEMGILAGRHLESDVVIEHTEFARNGHPGSLSAGQGHNIYIGTVRSFTLRFSYSHRAIIGHNVKSRAIKNYILYNRIADEQDGRASYAIDLPDGGLSFVIGNLIQQGPENDNRTVVAYGAEGYKNPLNELYFISNTLVNDDPKGGRFLLIQRGADAARVINNLFAGPGELIAGKAEARANIRIAKADLVDPDKLDYRPKARGAGIGKGVDAGSAYGFQLRPSAEYQHPLRMRPRPGSLPPDVGAHQHTE